MRLLRHASAAGVRIAVRDGDEVLETPFESMQDLLAGKSDWRSNIRPAGSLGRVLAPIRPRLMLCCGFNYPSHRDEDPNSEKLHEPFFFSKLPSAISDPGDPIRIPSRDSLVDWEVELAVVVGQRAHRVSENDALNYVFGWTLLNDVSARDLQLTRSQLTLGKGVDTFAPLGPEVVTGDELGDWANVELSTVVNGETMQSATAREMVFPPARLLAAASAFITLEPGDIVSTGTPAGVGCFRSPPVYLEPGDKVTVTASGIGSLTSRVIAGW